eukprot:6116429-Karenia_brevis.AAC.1
MTFVDNFTKSADSKNKLWVAPKRKEGEPEDKSQRVLNKIKRAICEISGINGKAILCDRSSEPR